MEEEVSEVPVETLAPKPSVLENIELKIAITATQKHGDSITGYTLYTVSTTTTLETYRTDNVRGEDILNHVVSRRYSDFDWLRHMLRAKYPGCIIPPLPDKTTTGMGRFDVVFVEARRLALSRFLAKLAFHAELYNSEDLRLFLTEMDPETWAQKVPWYEKGLLGTLGTSMSYWLGELRVTAEASMNGKGIESVVSAEDPEYLDLVDYFFTLEGRLTKLLEAVNRVVNVYKSFGATWAELGETALTLGKCETEGANALLNGRGGGLGMTLSHLGTSLEALAEPSQEECTNMVLGMKVPIKEYLAEIQ
ncbi:hypothetical protein CYMTET_7632, partial [Cymbomonas tetramitiformis]